SRRWRTGAWRYRPCRHMSPASNSGTARRIPRAGVTSAPKLEWQPGVGRMAASASRFSPNTMLEESMPREAVAARHQDRRRDGYRTIFMFDDLLIGQTASYTRR